MKKHDTLTFAASIIKRYEKTIRIVNAYQRHELSAEVAMHEIKVIMLEEEK